MPAVIAVDPRELGRFVVSGLTATLGNVAAVWLAGRLVAFEIALFAGLATGLTISFLMSKLFAFGSRSWDRAGGEGVRFLLVYCVGAAIYWMVAVAVGRLTHAYGLASRVAEPLGVLAGAGVMMVATYLGHRFFTYRTFEGSRGEGGL